jgi:hypothetical protein
MELSQEKKEQIVRNAEILQWKTQLLIEACDGWLSAEEGNRNMEKRIRENRKMAQQALTKAGEDANSLKHKKL